MPLNSIPHQTTEYDQFHFKMQKIFLLVLSCVLISTTAYAHSRAVSGDVRSAADDLPLSGVTGQVKGGSGTNGQYKPASDTLSPSDIWKKIGFFFAPPAEYAGQYRAYRSPLKFHNGRRVKTRANWKKRRIEILTRWTKLMGEWPPLLKDRQMKITDTVRRDGFTQYRARFNWTPNEGTQGFLLVPDGKGKKPAVITVYYEPETAVGLGKPDHPNRDFAYQLTKRGFVTFSLGTTEATAAGTFSLYFPDIENATVEPLSMLGAGTGLP